jgi:molecular chaperone IbpA
VPPFQLDAQPRNQNDKTLSQEQVNANPSANHLKTGHLENLCGAPKSLSVGCRMRIRQPFVRGSAMVACPLTHVAPKEDVVMRNFDLSPLFRSTVGFDRLTDMFESAMRLDEQSLSYPPYNIEKVGEEAYRITMAVAGFTESDIDVVAKDDTVVISGRIKENGTAKSYLHRGIAARAFERRFELAEHIRVAGAELENGLLHVNLVREVPEAARPRTIKVATKGAASAIEAATKAV